MWKEICIKKSIVSYVIAQFKKYKSFTFDFLKEENLSLDHPIFVNRKRRIRAQTTKKLGCGAQIRIRDTFSLPDITVSNLLMCNRILK